MVSKEEMAKILKVVTTNYPKYYKDISKEDKIYTINLWCEMFEDTDIKTLALALKSYISHSQFPPTIADIRNEIVKIIDNSEAPIDYWNKAYSLICGGNYLTREQWEKEDPIIKKYFGSPDRVKEKSMTENLNWEVEQSLFNKFIEAYLKHEKENKAIPLSVREKISELTSDIKMLKN